MKTKCVLSVQDISCFGQCSETVALPVLSASGVECAILPTSLLSTHTAGFQGYSVLDLSENMKSVIAHYQKEGIHFDGLLTGYLGKEEEVDDVLRIIQSLLKDKAKTFIDPAMGDDGKLYPAFDMCYAAKMRELVPHSDYLLPNMTEACFLADIPYRSDYSEGDVRNVAISLRKMGAKSVVLTGLTCKEGQLGIALLEDEELSFYYHERINRSFHGTGDLFSASFMGAMLSGKSASESIRIAAHFILDSIRNTLGDDEHWYGVHFEAALKEYQSQLAL